MRFEPWHKIAIPIFVILLTITIGCGGGWPSWIWEETDSTPYRSPAGFEFGINGDLDPNVVGPELDLRIAEWQVLSPEYWYIPHTLKYMVLDEYSHNGAVGGYEVVTQGVWLCWRTSPPLAAMSHELDHVVFGPEFGH